MRSHHTTMPHGSQRTRTSRRGIQTTGLRRVPPFHLVHKCQSEVHKDFQPRLDTERTGVSSEHTFGASDSGRIQFGVFQFPSSQQNFVHFSLHVGVPIVDSTRDSLTSQRRSVQPLTDSQGMAPQQSHHNKNCRDLIECDVQTTKCVFSVDRGSGIWPWFGSLNKVRRTWFCCAS